MGEFFRGWRRKTGVVTLVMALMFLAGWIRGYSVEDIIQFGNGDDTIAHILFLSHHGITWVKDEAFDGTRLGWTPGWGSVPIHSTMSYGTLVKGPIIGRWTWCGFDFCDTRRSLDIQRSQWTIPFWSIVIPLTLLSAFLLLRKPPPIPKNSRELVPTEDS